MSVLQKICDHKRLEVAQAKADLPESDLLSHIQNNEQPHCFFNQLQKFKDLKKPAIIAEIKQKSPSAGLIRDDFDLEKIAQSYTENNAACLSILTDQHYFGGHDHFIQRVKKVSHLPILRKDFMVDPYQILQSRLLGAHCVLLIIAVLSDDLIKQMSDIALSFGMDIIFEAHTQDEIERALKFKPQILGINSRDLKQQVTDIQSFERFKDYTKAAPICVAESGIHSSAHINEFFDMGYSAFLIGEYFMRKRYPGNALQNILKSDA